MKFVHLVVAAAQQMFACCGLSSSRLSQLIRTNFLFVIYLHLLQSAPILKARSSCILLAFSGVNSKESLPESLLFRIILTLLYLTIIFQLFSNVIFGLFPYVLLPYDVLLVNIFVYYYEAHQCI